MNRIRVTIDVDTHQPDGTLPMQVTPEGTSDFLQIIQILALAQNLIVQQAHLQREQGKAASEGNGAPPIEKPRLWIPGRN